MSSSNPSKGSSSDAKRKQEASKSKGKVGDWFRHISSSGKEYYFNVQTHASQWEKPDVWIEYEKKYGPVPSHPTPTKPTPAKPSSSHLQQRPHQHQHQHQHQSDSHSQQHLHQHATHNDREKEQRDRDRQNLHHQHHSNSITSTSAGHSNSSYQGGQTFSHNFNVSSNKPQSSNSTSISHNFHHHNLASSSRSLNHSFDHHHSSNSNNNNSSSISNSGQKHNSYPESLTKHPTFPPSSLSSSTRDSRKQSEDLQADDMDISPIDTDSPTDMKIITNPIITPSSSRDHGRMDSYGGNSNNKNHNLDSSMDIRDRDRDRERERDDNNRNISSSSYHRGGGGNNGYHNRDRDRDRDRYRDSPRRDYRERDRERDLSLRDRDRDRGRIRDRDQRERDRERSRSKLRDERSRSPWERDGTPERHGEPSSGGGGLSSLSSLTTLNPMEKSEDPLLTMAKYYREDLIEHIKNPMADSAEKQSNKLSEDILHTTAILLSKVSTELKMARGLVRLTEIQATLQEQRILFLREQIKTLQESGKDSSTRME